MTTESTASPWKSFACILCECNCGLEVQLGGDDGRRFVRFRGDKKHPASRGYACEKPHRLDYYQNGRDRLTKPLRRRADGTFEQIDWDTAIREVAARLARVRDDHGGDTIFYYGGGGQGNHLPGAYAGATWSADTDCPACRSCRSQPVPRARRAPWWARPSSAGSCPVT
jgi:anaerobic selenocysteine-containing dehydrogenase